MTERHDPRPRIQQSLVLLKYHFSAVIHRSHPQPGSLFRTQLLPGHDVGMVLQPGDDHLIVFTNIAAPPRLGHQIDALRRPANKDDLLR